MDVKAEWKKRLILWVIGGIGFSGLGLIALFSLLLVVMLGMFASSSDSSMDRIPVPQQKTFDIPAALLPLYIRAENETVSWNRLAAIQRVSTNFGLEKPKQSGTIGVFGFPRSLWETYQIDGDQDGKIDLDNPVDVIYSLANLFKQRQNEAESTLALLFPDPADLSRVYVKEQEYALSLVIRHHWLWPLVGYYSLSSTYGFRTDPITGQPGAFHDGIDIPAPRGTPVLAARDGIVVQVERSTSGYGNLVRLQHTGGVESFYGHLTDIGVTMGQTVHQGEVIGWVGSTGKSTGPHLHFGMAQNGQSVDPQTFVFNQKGGVPDGDGASAIP
ncbi:M23 family metallopeptidase [Paenibacillus alginolyticus]|uniref:M23 family metallopeptidase n=1 Tax=Paenibacillus alginolyticus TaxID=59839 RepID=UPI000411ADE5|nr:M23 family metallopeptidase [Paenibacillus alginolyticus]MCY9668721.1 M23 family metallopeptidase [Paenibacillus alginolyticus]